MRFGFGWLALAAASVPLSSTASAQNKTLAQAQFDWGLAEMQAGRYASGCPALAESYELDPLPGALFTLAECENKWGKLATALAHYSAYLDAFSRMTSKQKSDQVGRDQIAGAQRQRLDRDVPHLTVTLAASTPPGTTVYRDGELLGAPSLGVALPLDPGDHVIAAEASNGRRFEEHLVLTKGERRTLVVDLAPVSAPPPPPLPPVPAPVTPQPSASLVPPSAGLTMPPPASSGSARELVPPTSQPPRVWIRTAGAVGVVGVAVGAVAGVLTIVEKGIIDRQCGIDGVATACSSEGKSAADTSKITGLTSDVGFGVGVAGLATAFVLWATRSKAVPSSRGVAPVASVGFRTLVAGVDGAW